MILDKTNQRKGLTRLNVIAALALGTTGILTLAILRPNTPAIAAGQLVTQKQIGSVSVELAGITDGSGAWWDASGKRLPHALFDTSEYDKRNTPVSIPRTRRYDFALRILPASAKDLSVSYTVEGASVSSSIGTWTGKMKGNAHSDESQINATTNGYRLVRAFYTRPKQTESRLSVSIGNGTWSTAASCGAMGSAGSTLPGSNYSVVFSPVSVTSDGLTMTVSADLGDYDLRLVALDPHGRNILPTEGGDNSAGNIDQINATFAHLTPSRVKAYCLQTRLRHTVQFNDIPLHPLQ